MVGGALGRARRSNQGSGLRGGGPSPTGESRENFDWCAAAGVSGLHVAMLMHLVGGAAAARGAQSGRSRFSAAGGVGVRFAPTLP